MKNLPCDNCEVRISLEEEVHKFKFDTPIKSVDYKNTKSARYMFCLGCFFTIAILSLWMFLTNHRLFDLDDSTQIGLRSYYKLGEQGIIWDNNKLKWVVK